MLKLLRRLFGRPAAAIRAASAPALQDKSSLGANKHDARLARAPVASGRSGEAAVNRYFALSTIIERAKAEGDFARAIRAARDTYPLMPAVVRQIKKEY